MSFWTSLVVASAMMGPPKLPPMPGQSTPPEEPAPQTPKPPGATAKLPGAPTAKPKAVTPAPAQPATPTGPAAAQPPTPKTPAGSGSGFEVPNAEPPQPEPIAKPPAPSPSKPPRAGEGASPSMNPAGGPPMLPGADPSTTRPKLPPPSRPPHRGIGLFVGAGTAFAVALAQQIAGHIIVKRRCIEPVAEQSAMTDPFDSDTDAEEIGNAIIECVPGVLPIVALRVNSDLALLAAVGMATAGAVLRGERQAYDDAFASRMSKRIPALRGAGIGLVAGGALTWLTLGPASWGVLAKCDNAKCASRARAMAFISRDVGVALAAAGAGMLAFSESYRRRHEAFSRERALLWAPVVGRGFAGISLMQRF